VNLDPAATDFEYEPAVDIKDLITLEDAMEEMGLGPNGGLMACFEFVQATFPGSLVASADFFPPSRFLMENLDWLDHSLDDVGEDTLVIFDCPGQIELYTHVPILPNLAKHLTGHLQFSLAASYLLESTFVIDKSKFFAGTLSAMSAMIMLEIPHINIMSKMDLVKGQFSKRELKRFLDPDPGIILSDVHKETNPKFHKLNEC